MKKKKFLIAITFLALSLLIAEILSRFMLGLGSPPLSIPHPSIEYLFKPNQDIVRFGNKIFINQYGMRSDNFPVKKSTPNEVRIMVFGDSIINGGNLTDQNDLATTILQQRLSTDKKNSYIVGNISAGSWGPSNIYGYVKEYGFFDADIVIFVLSSHDATDYPTFDNLNPNTHPTANPPFALSEIVTRYLPKLFLYKKEQKEIKVNSEQLKLFNRLTLTDLKNLLQLTKDNVSNIYVFHHPEVKEINTKYGDGYQQIKKAANISGIKFIEMKNYIISNSKTYESYYRDNTHINKQGQLLYAEIFYQLVKSNNR